jgi:outer membrane PBP1 activator LpoA protein
MGYDAYFLAAAINSQKNNSMQELNGATGQLYMEKDGKIRRRLAWAQLINGNPKVQKKERDEQ